MSEKRKIVVFVDKHAKSVEKELADEAYTWEEYPDARLRAADKLMEASVGAGWFIENFGNHRHLSEHPEECAHCHLLEKIRKAIAEYEGKKNV